MQKVFPDIRYCHFYMKIAAYQIQAILSMSFSLFFVWL